MLFGFEQRAQAAACRARAAISRSSRVRCISAGDLLVGVALGVVQPQHAAGGGGQGAQRALQQRRRRRRRRQRAVVVGRSSSSNATSSLVPAAAAQAHQRLVDRDLAQPAPERAAVCRGIRRSGRTPSSSSPAALPGLPRGRRQMRSARVNTGRSNQRYNCSNAARSPRARAGEQGVGHVDREARADGRVGLAGVRAGIVQAGLRGARPQTVAGGRDSRRPAAILGHSSHDRGEYSHVRRDCCCRGAGHRQRRVCQGACGWCRRATNGRSSASASTPTRSTPACTS